MLILLLPMPLSLSLSLSWNFLGFACASLAGGDMEQGRRDCRLCSGTSKPAHCKDKERRIVFRAISESSHGSAWLASGCLVFFCVVPRCPLHARANRIVGRTVPSAPAAYLSVCPSVQVLFVPCCKVLDLPARNPQWGDGYGDHYVLLHAYMYIFVYI
ncbi:hypothetical protein MN608_04724 [Microdochium nivale]|nr:hypothetical protein MN608_04724 [Microdochium nivale]